MNIQATKVTLFLRAAKNKTGKLASFRSASATSRSATAKNKTEKLELSEPTSKCDSVMRKS